MADLVYEYPNDSPTRGHISFTRFWKQGEDWIQITLISEDPDQEEVHTYASMPFSAFQVAFFAAKKNVEETQDAWWHVTDLSRRFTSNMESLLKQCEAKAKTTEWIYNELFYSNSKQHDKWVSVGDLRSEAKKLFEKCAYIDSEGKPAFLCTTCKYYHGFRKGCSWKDDKKKDSL